MVRADQVKCIIAQHLGVDEHALAPDALFRDDLGADSLDAFELLRRLRMSSTSTSRTRMRDR